MEIFQIRGFDITSFESPAYTALLCAVQNNHRRRNMMMWLQNKGPVSHWETSADCRRYGLATENRPAPKHDSVIQKFRMMVTCCDCHQNLRLPAIQRKCSRRECIDLCPARARLKQTFGIQTMEVRPAMMLALSLHSPHAVHQTISFIRQGVSQCDLQ